jgi:chromosome segregation ATPase
MDINTEIRTRIVAAAEQLFVEAGSDRFPTVDEVRRAAKADMNTTSTVMKQWRREQVAAPATVAVSVPESVKDAALAATAQMWSNAQELANESLDVAKKAWEAERVEADTMRAELADAYESQATELADTAQALAETQATAKATDEKFQVMAAELAATSGKLTSEEGKRAELERLEQAAQNRIEELRDELAQEKTDADHQAKQHRIELEEMRAKQEKLTNDHAGQLAAAQKQYDTAAQELAVVNARAEAEKTAAKDSQLAAESQAGKLASELETARNSASEAREKAAELTGQITAITAQNKELMAMIETPKTVKKGTSK